MEAEKALLIKARIEQLRNLGHVYEVDDYDYDGNRRKRILIVINEADTKYYLHYLSIRTAEDANGTVNSYREYSVQTDRLYFLECVNPFIDENRRFNIFYRLIGQRLFHSIEIDKTLFVHAHDDHQFDEVRTQLLDEEERKKLERLPERFFHAKKLDTNLNIYQAYLFPKGHVILRQRNVSTQNTYEKEFCIKLVGDELNEMLKEGKNSTKIEYLFSLLGKHFLLSRPYKVVERIDHALDFSNRSEVSPIDQFLEAFDSGRHNVLLENRMDLLIELASDLYATALKHLQHPNEQTLGRSSDYIDQIVTLLASETIFNELVLRLTQLKEHLSLEETFELMRNMLDLQEIFIDLLEELQQWIQTLSRGNENDMACGMYDLINSVVYLNGFITYKEKMVDER